MISKTLGKLTTGLLLAGALAGCVDADLDVAVTSATTAKATLTQTMGAEFYTMFGLDEAPADAEAGAEQEAFCSDGALTENADGSASCTIVRQGAFAAIGMGGDGPNVQFTAAGSGLVRIALPTEELQAEVGGDEALDEETSRMLEAFFAGKAITLRFSGAEVIETNMTLSDDRTAAQTKIPFLDLMRGKAELPAEFFAIVRAP